MTYKDCFVAEVKCKGKILRVKNNAVVLPFGSDYSILLKNLNSKRASVKISIDGQDVLERKTLIVKPNETIELEGFLNGTYVKNKFRFIQKTKQIQDHRGDRIDDGIIRIEFAFEKQNAVTTTTTHNQIIYGNDQDPFHWNYRSFYTGNSESRYTSKGLAESSCFNNSDTNFSNVCCDSLDDTPNVDEGITVKGAECNQQFKYATMGELEESQVITLKLKGVTKENIPVKKTVTVDTKLICSTCGTKSKSFFKYCPNCGTFLELK